MATNPKSPVVLQSVRSQYHVYHAEAHVLSGNLKHPVDQPIEHKARVVLEKTRRDGHVSQSVAEDTMEGLISFKAGHTRASGTKIENPVTDGHVPRVTFLGTRFENFRIGGYPVEVELDLGICGGKPDGDRPYLQDRGFLDRVQRQFNDIAGAKGLPDSLEKQYDAKIAYIDDLKKRANGRGKGERNGYSKLQCSLVKSIGPIPIPGVKTFGNVIFIPDFGTVSLAEVEVGIGPSHDGFSDDTRAGSPQGPSDSNYFTLNMLDMHLGCIGGGALVVGSATANGHTRP